MMVAGEEKQGLTWKREGMMVGRALLVRDWGEAVRDRGEGRPGSKSR